MDYGLLGWLVLVSALSSVAGYISGCIHGLYVGVAYEVEFPGRIMATEKDKREAYFVRSLDD